MRSYTVHQLAKLAGVSVRTLHHYDQLGLLRPSRRSASGYRQYGEADLLRLQQILFYRELDVPLAEIQQIMDQPGFDPLAALRSHRRMLQERARRIERLLATVDKTIENMMEDKMELTDEELYEGFDKEQMEAYRLEAEQRWDPAVMQESYKRVRKLSKAQWVAVKVEGEAIRQGIIALADRDPADPQVQALIARNHAWIENFYACPAEMYRGLGELYVSDDRFRANYDVGRSGVAELMQAAMNIYADRNLK
jgi:DNA-binding transcriptional MerR regulator